MKISLTKELIRTKKNPCDPNPCEESESSTNTCVFDFSGKRNCYCQYGYEWNDKTLECVQQNN
ncbi:hypothetical protein II898_04380 [bacterium]|nr:hypothetical protein [bacterium]